MRPGSWPLPILAFFLFAGPVGAQESPAVRMARRRTVIASVGPDAPPLVVHVAAGTRTTITCESCLGAKSMELRQELHEEGGRISLALRGPSAFSVVPAEDLARDERITLGLPVGPLGESLRIELVSRPGVVDTQVDVILAEPPPSLDDEEKEVVARVMLSAPEAEGASPTPSGVEIMPLQRSVWAWPLSTLWVGRDFFVTLRLWGIRREPPSANTSVRMWLQAVREDGSLMELPLQAVSVPPRLRKPWLQVLGATVPQDMRVPSLVLEVEEGDARHRLPLAMDSERRQP